MELSSDSLSAPSTPMVKETSQQSDVESSSGWELKSNDFPDGGLRAWSVVAGAWATQFSTFGWINCIGVFQAYYQENYLKGYSPTAISWIPSLELSILYGGSFIVGRAYDRYGPRWLTFFGTFMHVFGLMMASLSTKYYQILLSQGICSAIGICCLVTPAMACVTTWFQRRRGFAWGIVSTSSSFAGVSLPILFNRMITKFGFPWAMRICALVILGLLLFANLTMVARLPPSPAQLPLKAFFKPFTERAYLFTVISAFVFFLGLFVPINYIATQAIELGMSPDLAQYLIPILNSTSLFGRVLAGIANDKLGPFNTQTIFAFYSSITVLALWIPASSNAAVIVFAGLYGFGFGGYVTLLPTLVAQVSPMREIGHRTGMQFGVLAIPALISNPIGGAFVAANDGGYAYIKIWTGVVLLAGAGMYAFTRVSLGGVKLLKKV